ncbi:class I SAM-dependent methyltransferase [Myxococcota bacterium]|nr:class I SAM-dependent methyltransferase [Myxococcota bacterium]
MNDPSDRDRVEGSFRDPSGFLFYHDGLVHRQVNPSFQADYDQMMQSGFFEAAVSDGLLISHEEIEPSELPDRGAIAAYKVLLPEQIPFVSYPFEWSFSQLQDAALLTLKLQLRALEFGLSLKDASAYNVQFLGGRPVFIDTLSFEAYAEGRPWVAYQQFCTHFLAPLALMAYRHPELNKLLRIYIDGIPLEVAAPLLPTRTRLRPALLAHLHLHARAVDRYGEGGETAKRARKVSVAKNALIGLVRSLESATRRLSWKPEGTEWAEYYDDTNYSQDAHEQKKALVAQWVEEVDPASVWDLGANTGLFSRLAADRGIPTVAFDADVSAVEKNYCEIRERGETGLLPLVMDLTNPTTNLGWDGTERMSLGARGPADLVMALALVHHLAIGNNVPLDRVAQAFRRLARSLIVEFVPKSDSQVQRLLASREDIFPDYTEEGFERAFQLHFTQRSRTRIPGTERTLYLFDSR